MAGVAVIYITRRLTSPRACKAYALVSSFIGIAFFASVPQVVANFLHAESVGILAFGPFLLSAVSKTNGVVQVALLVAIAALFSIARDMVKASQLRHFA